MKYLVIIFGPPLFIYIISLIGIMSYTLTLDHINVLDWPRDIRSPFIVIVSMWVILLSAITIDQLTD